MTALRRLRERLKARIMVALASLAVAAALVVFSAPVVRGEFARLFVAELETAVRGQASLSADELANLAGVLEDAHAYRADPAIAQELALIQMLRLENEAASGADVSYERTAALLRDGLSARPAAPHGWTRLARVRFRQDLDRKAVREALVLAVTTGPMVRRLTVPRLEIGLRIWNGLSEYERGLVRRQARLAFESRPEAAVRVALAAGRPSVVRGALRSLSARARFDALVAEARE